MSWLSPVNEPLSVALIWVTLLGVPVVVSSTAFGVKVLSAPRLGPIELLATSL